MTGRAARRLPGVQIESRPARLPDDLPRMDVAAFVGFAASGPLDLPVVVEDPATFAGLYGPDVTLAWDRERCEPARAQLGAAVRAFFENGGTRCWVVRVAGRGREAPVANAFPLPALLRRAAGGLRPAFARARSEGSWSDGLAAGTALQLQPVPVIGLELGAGGVPVAARLAAPDIVAAGDLLRLAWRSTGDLLLAPVASVTGDRAAFVDGAALRVRAGAPAPGPLAAHWFPREESAGEALPPLDREPVWLADGQAVLTFAGEAPPEPGHLVRLARPGEELWLAVAGKRVVEGAGSPPGLAVELTGRVTRVAAPAPAPAGELPVGERARLELWVRSDGGQPTRLGDLGLAPGHPRYLGGLPTDRLLFAPDEDLLERSEEGLRGRLRALAGDGADLRAYHADLWQAVANPRFPLAVDAGAPDAFFPAGMLVLPDAYLGRQAVAGDPAERSGLHALRAAAFLDEALAGETTEGLAARADFVRWQAPAPRRLTGIHALLAIDEVTLVAAPDAVQRGWSAEDAPAPEPLATPVLTATVIDAQGRWRLDWTAPDPQAAYALAHAGRDDFAGAEITLLPPGTTSFLVPPPEAPGRRFYRVRAYLSEDERDSFWSDPVAVVMPPPQFTDCGELGLGAPQLALASGPDAGGSYRLAWSPVAGALRTLVQESSELDFSAPTVVFRGAGGEAAIYGRAPGRYHVRARAEGRAAAVGPAAQLGDDVVLEVTGAGTPRHLLVASYAAAGEETVFDGAAFTERFRAGSERDATPAGFRYRLRRDDAWPGAPGFRAFALDVAGPWSNGVTVFVAAPPRRVLARVAGYDAAPLLEVQAGLARMCAARGDLLGVLALPEHYREDDAVRHAAALRARLPEEMPWSHAALYHPWLVVEEDAGGLRRTAPDGAMCGAAARRAASRGAWVAPANQPLGGVLGLSRTIDRPSWPRLFEAQVNLVRQEPQGFVAAAADTLALDPGLRPINVRRLLALLRRVALRLAPTFVFEPMGDVFRRAVERELAGILDGMFRAGAFAGPGAGSSYQVVVDVAGRAEGRMVVELKVAPSLPLELITVRLVQSDGRSRITEVR